MPKNGQEVKESMTGDKETTKSKTITGEKHPPIRRQGLE
jgi:hypothetical protein